MRSSGPGHAIIAAVIALAMVGGLGYSLASGQSRARDRQKTAFVGRAKLAAQLTGSAISSGGAGAVAQSFAGTGRALVAEMRTWESSGSVDQRAGLIDAHGRVLVSWPIGTDRAFAASYPRQLLAKAARWPGGAYGDLVMLGSKKSAWLWIAARFNTAHGARTLVSLSSAAQMSAFAAPYLRSAPGVQGAQGYLIDGHGLVISSSTNLAQGARLPVHDLATAALSGDFSGLLGGTFWAAARVDSGTNWRVVFATRQTTLLAPVQSSNVISWVLFGLFLMAVLALMGLARAAIKKSAQLGTARERERAAQELAHERLHDALTGLPNRQLFLDRTETALGRSTRTGRPVAVMFTDIDHFKLINDSLGHAAGDELLTMLAQRLSESVRPHDTVSRFGGDEFLVLCDELVEENDALRIAARIREALDTPFELGNRRVHVTCCIGIAIHNAPAPLIEAPTLVRDADAAMYQAKLHGPGQLRVFDDELHAGALRRLDTELALRAALANDELFVHYQPIVELPGGRWRGVEALARWNRDGNGLVPPPEFIGMAEECGLIDDLGHRVLEMAMNDVRAWDDAGLLPDDFMLSVNVSPRQLADSGFPARVAELLGCWPLPPEALCLEMTESTVASESRTVELALERLTAIGVQLAIDDFGVGISSLGQLVRSGTVDVIKLDRSFVADLSNPRERSVAAAVAPMVTSLGMDALAEGVERAEQARELHELGYTLAQGFYFGRPMPALGIVSFLAAEAQVAA